ncbi:hypothetical protein NQ317_000597 [Molorchus minor]|uniref:LITAF domain-containing protein n=1 Tax=Molorchus minor TaxID=1323400 RepID=A0ABQ9J152_9CUCU|nr:hypothetical protein NQ317_000597 [Molorchus minor]
MVWGGGKVNFYFIRLFVAPRHAAWADCPGRHNLKPGLKPPLNININKCYDAPNQIKIWTSKQCHCQQDTPAHHLYMIDEQIFYAPMVLGPNPQAVTCPSCHAQITTNVQLENSTKTHLIAIVLCLICLPCVMIPYCCTDSCKSKNHYCPNCQAYIGRYDN